MFYILKVLQFQNGRHVYSPRDGIHLHQVQNKYIIRSGKYVQYGRCILPIG